MSIKKQFGGQSINIPGAYSKFRVDNTGGTNATTGTLLLVGESSKGAPGSTSGVLEFNASQLQSMAALFGAGPLVDCAVAALRPSNTPGVGGAGKILVYKTNASTQAQINITQNSVDSITVKDKAFGVDGNKFSIKTEVGTTAEQAIISIIELGGTTEVLGENLAETLLTVEYTGDATTAVLAVAGATRAAMTMTVTLAGDQTDGSVDLSIALGGKTIKELVDAINALAGFAAVITSKFANDDASIMDITSAIDVKTAKPVKALQAEIIALINTSTRVEATEIGPKADFIDFATFQLAGGVQGISTNTTFSNGLEEALQEDIQVIVPCISSDAGGDTFTDIASTFDIDSVVAAVSANLALRASIKNRKESQAVVGVQVATLAAANTKASEIADASMQLVVQDVAFLNSIGTIKVGKPHVTASLVAGMRLGTEIGEPLTHKLVKATKVGHILDEDTLADTGTINTGTDTESLIDGGVTVIEKAGSGFRVVVDNTTYGTDASFVYNRGSVIEAVQYVSKTLRQTAEDIFIGKKVSNGIAQSIKSILRNKLRELNQPDIQIITSSEGAPEGFREDTFTVTVTGNTANVSVEILPVQGMEFIFIDFTLGDINQTA